MRRSRKPLNLYGFREFESHPHRQISLRSISFLHTGMNAFGDAKTGKPF